MRRDFRGGGVTGGGFTAKTGLARDDPFHVTLFPPRLRVRATSLDERFQARASVLASRREIAIALVLRWTRSGTGLETRVTFRAATPTFLQPVSVSGVSFSESVRHCTVPSDPLRWPRRSDRCLGAESPIDVERRRRVLSTPTLAATGRVGRVRLT